MADEDDPFAEALGDNSDLFQSDQKKEGQDEDESNFNTAPAIVSDVFAQNEFTNTGETNEEFS